MNLVEVLKEDIYNKLEEDFESIFSPIFVKKIYEINDKLYPYRNEFESKFSLIKAFWWLIDNEKGDNVSELFKKVNIHKWKKYKLSMNFSSERVKYKALKEKIISVLGKNPKKDWNESVLKHRMPEWVTTKQFYKALNELGKKNIIKCKKNIYNKNNKNWKTPQFSMVYSLK